MTRVTEHSDDKLVSIVMTMAWRIVMKRAWIIVMKRAWRIVMTVFNEHTDDKGQGTLC